MSSSAHHSSKTKEEVKGGGFKSMEQIKAEAKVLAEKKKQENLKKLKD